MGYLDTRKHTSNNLEYTKMVCPNYKGEKFYELGPAVSDANYCIRNSSSGICNGGTEKIDVFTLDALHSWYNLNKTHKPEYFFQLMNSINK